LHGDKGNARDGQDAITFADQSAQTPEAARRIWSPRLNTAGASSSRLGLDFEWVLGLHAGTFAAFRARFRELFVLSVCTRAGDDGFHSRFGCDRVGPDSRADSIARELGS